MAAHSSILAWRIPWTEEPGGLKSMGPQRVGCDWVTDIHTTHTHSWMSRDWGTLNVDPYSVIYSYLNELSKAIEKSFISLDFSIIILNIYPRYLITELAKDRKHHSYKLCNTTYSHLEQLLLLKYNIFKNL